MKKSVKDQTTRAFQVGGYNPPSVPQQPYTQPTQVNPQTGTYTLPGSGIAGYQVPSGAPTGYAPYGGTTPYFQPVQFTGPQFQTSLQTTNLPTFAETVGSKPGQYDELRTYINDAGQTLQIPFKDGRPIYPIPEGYRPIGDQPKAEQPTTVTPTLGQAQVRDEGGGDGVGVVGTGYKGLSRSTTSTSKGISEAAAKAKADLGITGFTGHSLGSLAAFVGMAMGIPGAMGLAGKENIGFIGATPAQSGMTGTLDQGTLESIAKGDFIGATGQSAIGLSQSQAQAVLDAQYNYNVQLNGLIGYTTGSISPNYGTPVRNGMTVDSAFGPNAQPEYASVSDMIATVTKGINSGWRGGYVSQDTYNNMTPEQQANYDNFDPTFGNRADEDRADAALEGMTGRGEEDATRGEISAAEAAIESMTSGKGIPADVQAEIDAALAAAGRGDLTSGNIGKQGPSFDDSSLGKGGGQSTGNFGAGQSTRGDDSDTGRGSGGTGQGSSSDGSAGGPGSGTDGGASSGCFEKGTLFKMADGTTKCVEDIKPGDKMYKGGLVYAVMQGDGLLEDWYDYNGIHVTSGHPVLDNGVWKRVGETSSKKAIDKREVYYSLMNTNHLMIAENGTEFTDFVEISADIGGRGEWMMEMLNQRQAA